MSTTLPYRRRIQELKARYDALKPGKESLLTIIDESELSESVYNSNAIENSTLTLQETERILLQLQVARDLNIREVYEAKNLANVIEYIQKKSAHEDLSLDHILLLHTMLMTNIDDSIAGRFRAKGEYVRVGMHVAPAPEKVDEMIQKILIGYSSDSAAYFVDAIALFHLAFETIHPFNDGNGRIGRVLMNYQLLRRGFPMIIVRNKEKRTYYESFDDYQQSKKVKGMEHIVALALMESLHKRVTYLAGAEIVSLTDFCRAKKHSASALLNAARRQTIPAFREKGTWKIARDAEV
jgi:Fic family protein